MKAKQSAGYGSLVQHVKSPTVRMDELITKIEKEQPFLCKMHPEVKAMFEGLALHMNFPMKFVFKNMWCFGGILTKIIPSLNASAGSMLRTTCTFKNLNSTKTGDCTVGVFFRCINQEDLQKDLETFYQIAKEYGVELDEVVEDEYHRPANIESKEYQYIKSIVEKEFDLHQSI